MQSQIISSIKNIAESAPTSPALQDAHVLINYEELMTLVDKTSLTIKRAGVVALLLDNSPAWVLLDLACLNLGITSVPIPAFFSDSQILHALKDANVDTILTDQPERLELILASNQLAASKANVPLLGKKLVEYTINTHNFNSKKTAVKFTYTSGTTGQPKGVCLSEQAIFNVALSLKKATHASQQDKHFCVLPLASLLENIAGVYVPLMSGACLFIAPLADFDFYASSIAFLSLIKAINLAQATSLILTPELLRGILVAYKQGYCLTAPLRFIAIGGAHVPEEWLNQAKAINLPMYQGYGLSECASVVSLNTETENKVGSVGKVLPHLDCKIDKEGEILIKNSQFMGYQNQPFNNTDAYLPTGDIGYLDSEGYLYITGRKKNIFITSFGRNVSPEWVESSLLNHSAIYQAAVFGESQPFNVAVLVTNPNASKALIELAIHQTNRQLPNYAQINRWVLAHSAFSPANGLTTSNLRLKRAAIYQTYKQPIEDCYLERNTDVL
jgi:long-chain acyl-CoA synthetase